MGATQRAAASARSLVKLPDDVDDDFEVYLNGVSQRRGVDFELDGRTLVFDRVLRRDKISGWRWFLGAWGAGTYRQDDTVDVRYEAHGIMRIAHKRGCASSWARRCRRRSRSRSRCARPASG